MPIRQISSGPLHQRFQALGPVRALLPAASRRRLFLLLLFLIHHPHGHARTLRPAYHLIVHGQNSFQDQRSLFYGESLVSWFNAAAFPRANITARTFLNPQSLLATIQSSPYPLRLYLSTHMTGEGPNSAPVIGNAPLSMSKLLTVLEARPAAYELWVDACNTGYAPPLLKNGLIHLAPKGDETESDVLGLTPFGDKALTNFGLPTWTDATDLAGEGSGPTPGPFQLNPAVTTWPQAAQACHAQGARLCAWRDWRRLPLGNARLLCTPGEKASWLADTTGDGRAMLWLGCQHRPDARNFGARQKPTPSPEIGWRCCPAEK